MYLMSKKLCYLLALLTLAGCKPTSIHHDSSRPSNGHSGSSERCPKAVPEPYTGPLIIQSKYNQNDKSKSTLSASKDKRSVLIQKNITDYSKGLIRFSEYATNNKKAHKQQVALSCLHAWLTAWADGEALTTKETTKTGVAVRKWTLATISFVAIRTEKLTQGKWTLNTTERQWLSALADKVVEDYNPRLTQDFKYFNNHDHWAAWSVFSTGYLLKEKRYMDWGKAVFDKAITKAVIDQRKQYAYFPNEIARKHLASNYTNFSLTPLVLLEYYLPKAGYKVSAEQHKVLSYMANFASDLILNPSAVRAIVKVKQAEVKSYKLAWLLPYLKQNPESKSAQRLYQSRGGKVDGYSQLGGKIRPLYEPRNGQSYE